MNTTGNQPSPRKRKKPPRSRAAESIHRRLSGLVLSLLTKKGTAPLSGLPDQIELNLRIPIRLDGAGISESRDFARTLVSHVESLRLQGETEALGLRSGHAPCYWCNAVVCEHSQPPDQHSVLDGWSQTGVPLWKNLTTVLLDTKDDQLDVIYGETPGPVIVWRSEPELLGQTLPEFMDGSISARPVGALVAGGFALPSPNGDPELLSVTALIQESRAGRSTPKYTLNLISSTPPPHHLASLVGSGICIALTNWVRSLRSSLSSLQHQLSSMAQKGNRTSIQKSRQLVVERLIESRSYLKTLRRRSERRTLHAEERSTEPDRPTSAAISDLRSCDLDDLYHDRKESTIIVRGKQGRIHVFTVNGRHVTSAIYGRDAIHARIARHRWRKMDPKEGQFFLANTCKDLPRIDSQEKDVS